MAKLKEHISHIGEILSNGPRSDDFQFTDEHIYFIIQYIRAFLLKQKIDRGKYINPQNYQTIPCFKLDLLPIVDCECYTADCYGLQSVCNLPRIISSDKGLFIDGIYTVNSNKPQKLDRITLDQYRLSEYSKTMKEVKGYFIEKGKLYVTGFDRLQAVKITALFEDPLDILTMSPSCGCNEDGTQICIDPYEVEFPLDMDLSRSLYMMTYEELVRVAMMLPRDNENDSNIPLQRPQLPGNK